MTIKRKINKPGFTLVELMLAMGFVSVLLIAVAMIIIQIAGIYNRGMTLKEVSQAGRSLSIELQKSINGSSMFDISAPNTSNSRLQTSAWNGGGRLCTGQYSYIWNSGKDIYSASSTRNLYSNSTNEIRFVKVLDTNASYCTNTSKKVVFGDAVELMSVGDHNLAIHYFSISSSVSDKKTGQQLYSIEFLVGTNDQAALKDDPLDAKYKICKLASESGADPAYCSVNKFNIIARAGNIAE